MYGIFVAGGATLTATEVNVVGAGASPINGCQGGVGIEVGTARTEPSEIGHATLLHDNVSQYMKNGITDEGEGSSISVTSTNVKGAGETTAIAQNGIQVSYGASGKITKSEITGNECNNENCGNSTEDMTKSQSTGVLFYLGAKGSSVTNSHINENDIGAYQYAEKEENKPWTTINSNVMNKDRYEAVVLDQGYASVNKNEMSNGEVGIQLLQYAMKVVRPLDPGARVLTMKSRECQGGRSRDCRTTYRPISSVALRSPKAKSVVTRGATVPGSVSTNNPTKLKIFTNNTDS